MIISCAQFSHLLSTNAVPASHLQMPTASACDLHVSFFCLAQIRVLTFDFAQVSRRVVWPMSVNVRYEETFQCESMISLPFADTSTSQHRNIVTDIITCWSLLPRPKLTAASRACRRLHNGNFETPQQTHPQSTQSSCTQRITSGTDSTDSTDSK